MTARRTKAESIARRSGDAGCSNAAVAAHADTMNVPSSAASMAKLAIVWCAGVALIILAVNFFYQLRLGIEKPPGLTYILIPVNMFTGVFACGLICLLNPWMGRRLPPQHRMPLALVALNIIGGVAFILVALRSYWDYAGWNAMAILLGILALGIVATWLRNLLWK
jgi:hypothetical protein